MKLNKLQRKMMAEIGRIGGKSKSVKKLAAVKANLAIAREARQTSARRTTSNKPKRWSEVNVKTKEQLTCQA